MPDRGNVIDKSMRNLILSGTHTIGPGGLFLTDKWRAGIVAGEIALGLLLLVISGIFHRRYRWRQERSWVLFDWDVVQEPKTPRQFFPRHLPHWLHMSVSLPPILLPLSTTA